MEDIDLPKLAPTSISEEEIEEIVTRTDLSSKERQKLLNLLLSDCKVFCRSNLEKPGSASWGHHIPLLDTNPSRERIRRQTQKAMEVTGKEVEKMLSQNIIQPPSSPWAVSVQLVPKKHGSIRCCIDYRKLNN